MTESATRESSGIFATIPDAVAAIARGEIVVVVDDEDRENEGDLIMAAEHATPEAITFFVRHTSGVICAPLTSDRLEELDIPLMVHDNTEAQRTAFMHTVDLRHGTSTGISAADRSATIKALCDPATRPGDLARPGHIFPLRYAEGGVLKRAGHTEAAVDLARLAGCYPAGVLCEIVNDDGTMARVPDLVEFCKEHNLLMISIAQMVKYRRQTEKLVRRVAEARIPTLWGDFTCYVYESLLDGEQHVAMVKGAVAGEIYERLGMIRRAARAYEKAGAISQLEYTLGLLERSMFGSLTRWLDRLTTHDLSQLDVRNCPRVTSAGVAGLTRFVHVIMS